MLRIPIDQEIKLAHDTLLKAKGNDSRMPDGDHLYSIEGLTANEMKCIWQALEVYEGMLRDRQ